jgi:hypothetical protein
VEAILPGLPLIVTEGEIDRLLVNQEIGGRAGVITLGSATASPSEDLLHHCLCSPLWLIATDSDKEGEDAAQSWLRFPRAQRVRPPLGKDWNDAWKAGIGLLGFWEMVLDAVGATPNAPPQKRYKGMPVIFV